MIKEVPKETIKYVDREIIKEVKVEVPKEVSAPLPWSCRPTRHVSAAIGCTARCKLATLTATIVRPPPQVKVYVEKQLPPKEVIKVRRDRDPSTTHAPASVAPGCAHT